MDAVGAERDREVTDDCAGFGKNRLRRGQLDDSVAHGAEGQIASCPRGAHRGRRFWRRVTVPDFGVPSRWGVGYLTPALFPAADAAQETPQPLTRVDVW